MRMTEHAVVIVGAGPTGMMLAAELALAGTDVAILERRPSQEIEAERARGLHARSLEVLDQRGIVDRFLAEGEAAQTHSFAGVRLDISDFPTRFNHGLALGQRHFERILAGWVDELRVPIVRGHEVTGFAQDEDGVTVQLSDGAPVRAQYLVGCDGGRSVIRKTAGIAFPGWEASTSWLIAEVEMTEQPQFGVRHGGGIGPAEGGLIGVVLPEPTIGDDRAPSLEYLRELLVGAEGTDYGAHSPTWISRFTDMIRQAASYRHGRVLIAGDAAHLHPPQGGQGLNTGVQDAVNLGWKLAQVLNGFSPESLLDTYHGERHAVGARVQRDAMAQRALRVTDEHLDPLRATVTELLSMDEPRTRFAGIVSGLSIHYDLGDGHPLLGRRMPDLDIVTSDGPVRVFELLHRAKPVLLNLGEHGPDITPWADRVTRIDAQYNGAWELPVLGVVAAPSGVVIRPDGYVAWVAEDSDRGLAEALATWFGAPATA